MDSLTSYTQLVRTSNYSATANLHNSQITTAPNKLLTAFVSSPTVSWQRLLIVKIIQLHALRSSLETPRTELKWSLSHTYNISPRTTYKHAVFFVVVQVLHY
jgi:hypothetical protein